MGFDAPTPVSGLARVVKGHSGWDAETVGEKIVEAFVTLDRLPKVRTPRGPGSNWPSVMVEWSDQLAQAELEESERKEREQDANRVKICPSAIEITKMEQAFEWLRWIRFEDSAIATIVTCWALRTARGRSIRRLCIEKGWAPRTFWRKRGKGLIWLAEVLNARAVPVF